MACILKFDGASKGNPGKAGAGAVLMTEDGGVVSRISEGLGVTTNNVAEYRGLILGLKHAVQHGFKRIEVHGDSQLVRNQVNGVWQTKNQKMRELCNEVRQLKENFDSFEMIHVQRESNAEADHQANIGTKLANGEQFVEDQEFFDDQDPQECFEQDQEELPEDLEELGDEEEMPEDLGESGDEEEELPEDLAESGDEEEELPEDLEESGDEEEELPEEDLEELGDEEEELLEEDPVDLEELGDQEELPEEDPEDLEELGDQEEELPEEDPEDLEELGDQEELPEEDPEELGDDQSGEEPDDDFDNDDDYWEDDDWED